MRWTRPQLGELYDEEPGILVGRLILPVPCQAGSPHPACSSGGDHGGSDQPPTGTYFTSATGYALDITRQPSVLLASCIASGELKPDL